MLKISEAEYREIKSAAKANKNKRVAKRLEVLELRYYGKSNAEISERTGFNERYITTLMGLYKKQGLEEFIRIKQTSHRRNMTAAEEAEVLTECEQDAEAGNTLTAQTKRKNSTCAVEKTFNLPKSCCQAIAILLIHRKT